MKRVIVALMLAVVFAGTAGCQKAKSSTRVSTGGRAGGLAAGATTTPSGVSLTAAVKSVSADFELAVQDVLEATMPRDYVGRVSGAASDGTGVFLGGKVTASNGGPISVANGVQSIAQNSELLLVVYDSFYAQAGLDPIPPIYLRSASGAISGNSVDIKFSDSYGFIRLVGQFDRDRIVADVYYETTRTYDGKVGWNGKLGRAEIPTCSFFRCN